MIKYTTQSYFKSMIYGVVLFLAIPMFSMAQKSHMVVVTNNIYTPKDITIEPGDTVIWICQQGFHNVNGTQQDYPNNSEYFGNSVASDWTFKHVFTEVGMNNYQCDPHVNWGMLGTVTVKDSESFTNLTLSFSGMTPHTDQLLVLYVKDIEADEYIDTLSVDHIPDTGMFDLTTSNVQTGSSYNLDFYADHNGNGEYDAPPVDHAWRIEVPEIQGETNINFNHNGNFTDIFASSSGISGQDLRGIVSVYPNPVSEILTISMNQSGFKVNSISLISLRGQVILKENPENIESDYYIDLTTVPAGNYFLHLGDESGVRKVISLVKN